MKFAASKVVLFTGGWMAFAALRLKAQVDLAGEWGSKYTWDYQERLPGPELGDYTGLPINEAARLKADSWEASVQTLPERQCIPHGPDYLFSRAAFPFRRMSDCTAIW